MVIVVSPLTLVGIFIIYQLLRVMANIIIVAVDCMSVKWILEYTRSLPRLGFGCALIDLVYLDCMFTGEDMD